METTKNIAGKTFKVASYSTKSNIYVEADKLTELITKTNASDIIDELKSLVISEVEKQCEACKKADELIFGECEVRLSFDGGDSITVSATYDDREGEKFTNLAVSVDIDEIDDEEDGYEEHSELAEVLKDLEEYRSLTEDETRRICRD